MHCLWGTQGDMICSQTAQNVIEGFNTINAYRLDILSVIDSRNIETPMNPNGSGIVNPNVMSFSIPRKWAVNGQDVLNQPGWVKGATVTFGQSLDNPHNFGTIKGFTTRNNDVVVSLENSIRLMPMRNESISLSQTPANKTNAAPPAPASKSVTPVPSPSRVSTSKSVQVQVREVNGVSNAADQQPIKAYYFWILKSDYARIKALFPNGILPPNVSATISGSATNIISVNENLVYDPELVQINLGTPISIKPSSASTITVM